MSDKQFNIEKKKYVKEVNSYLICDWGTRNKFIRDLKNDMNEYIENDSVTDFDSVYSHFGDPQSISKGFLETADTKKIKRKMNIKTVIVTGIIIVLMIFTLALTISVIDAHKSYYGHDKTVMSDAEYGQIRLLDLGGYL